MVPIKSALKFVLKPKQKLLATSRDSGKRRSDQQNLDQQAGVTATQTEALRANIRNGGSNEEEVKISREMVAKKKNYLNRKKKLKLKSRTGAYQSGLTKTNSYYQTGNYQDSGDYR